MLAVPAPEACARTRPDRSTATAWNDRPGTDIVSLFRAKIQEYGTDLRTGLASTEEGP